MKPQTRKLAARLALALGIAVSVSDSANAAFLSFADTLPAESITMTADDFEYGSVATNFLLPVQIGLNNPGSFTVNGSASLGALIDFGGWWVGTTHDVLNNYNFSRNVYFVDPGTNLVRDVLFYQIGTNISLDPVNHPDDVRVIIGVFQSLGADQIGFLPVGVDPNDVFAVNSGPFEFTFENLSMQLFLDAPTAVPEPGSLVLLGSGLAGLAAWRQKRHRA